MAEALTVEASAWVVTIAELKSRGHDMLLQLTAVDELGRTDEIRVVAQLENSATGEQVVVTTSVPRDAGYLEGLTSLYPGASWLQRQVHEFFGVEFIGDDNRPLLHHGEGHPLRKDLLLQPRIDHRWPGALEPGESDASPSRRRLLPPGVPDTAHPGRTR